MSVLLVPGFQDDGAFQLAAQAGFQTQTVAIEPPAPRPPTSIWVTRGPGRRRGVITGEFGLVLALEGALTFRPAPRRRTRIPGEIVAGPLEWGGTWRVLDYVADVLIPEEEELLALL